MGTESGRGAGGVAGGIGLVNLIQSKSLPGRTAEFLAMAGPHTAFARTSLSTYIRHESAFWWPESA